MPPRTESVAATTAPSMEHAQKVTHLACANGGGKLRGALSLRKPSFDVSESGDSMGAGDVTS